MKNLLEILGMSDGEGNTSSTRLLAVAVLILLLGPKAIYATVHGVDIVWDENTLTVIKIVFASLIGKTVAEGVTNKLTTPNATPATQSPAEPSPFGKPANP